MKKKFHEKSRTIQLAQFWNCHLLGQIVKNPLKVKLLKAVKKKVTSTVLAHLETYSGMAIVIM